MEFEWDDAKAISNFKKHGVSFDDARLAFKDPRAYEEIDDAIFYGEERWKIVGLMNSVLIAVIYTPRNSKVRMISARKASPHEEQDYYLQT